MGDITKISLVSSEIAGLWESYMSDTLAVCVLKSFLNRVDDSETRSILELTLELCNQNIHELINFFDLQKLPVPDGFTEEDVNLKAPRLFIDEFYLLYLTNLSRGKLLKNTQILNNSARSDIRNYFIKLIIESSALYDKVSNIRLNKGLFIRTPCVEVPKNVEYIKSKKMISYWTGNKRSLLVGEITHISTIILSNIVGKALTTGFGQVSKDKEVKAYMFNGRDMSTKKIDRFTSILQSENIPAPATPYTFVTDATTAPFSEKLMMFHITAIGGISVANDGLALSETLRSDLQTNYMQIMAEAMKFAKKGTDIMIENKWLEQPPQAIKHEDLVGV